MDAVASAMGLPKLRIVETGAATTCVSAPSGTTVRTWSPQSRASFSRTTATRTQHPAAQGASGDHHRGRGWVVAVVVATA